MILKDVENLIEGLLFIKGEEGINIEFLAEFLDINSSEAENILNVFKNNYSSETLVVKKFGNIYKLLVKDNIYKIIKEKIELKNLSKLSKVAMETLAIIAYNQPISKIEIDNIRGVNSDYIINSLIDRDLIISNKISDKIGKPKLYETTDLFLDIFGLETLDDLPKLNKADGDLLDKFLDN